MQVHIEGEGMKLADGRIYVPLPFIHKNFPEESVWPVVLQADVYVNNECIRESHPVSCLGGEEEDNVYIDNECIRESHPVSNRREGREGQMRRGEMSVPASAENTSLHLRLSFGWGCLACTASDVIVSAAEGEGKGSWPSLI